MSNPFKRYVQHFLSFSRSDRNSIVIIGILILIVLAVNVILRNTNFKSNTDFTEIKALIREWELAESEKKESLVFFDFDPNIISKKELDSLSIPKHIKQNIIRYREAGGKYKVTSDVRKIYGMNDSIFSLIENHIQIEKAKVIVAKTKTKKTEKIELTGNFEPNSATFAELKKFGFSNYQANNLLSYRNKGGSISTASDLLKIYGIDSVFYQQIEKYVFIEEKAVLVATPIEANILVEINSADSTEWVRLNGIGPYYAKRIIKYRNLLGGFSSKEQLREIYNFPEETYAMIQQRIYVDTLKISKLRINFLEYADLLRHPYLNKNDVKLILNTREKKGAFQNDLEVGAIKGIDAETFSKIRPYITCR